MENLDRNGGYSATQPQKHTLPIQAREIFISQIQPMKNQPRTQFHMKPLEELAASIKEHGIIQPLVVSETPHGTYQIIAGERRWRAAQLAGLVSVPCIVKEIRSDNAKLELALIENIQREELSCVDEAVAVQHLIEAYGYTQEEVAKNIGKERATVANSVRLLSLPKEILKDLQESTISSGHGRCLCALESAADQLSARDLIVSKKLSVRQTEDLVKKMKNGLRPKAEGRGEEISPDLRHLCDLFKGHLGTKVKFTGAADRGKIEISYYSLEDLERISDLMLGNPLLGRNS